MDEVEARQVRERLFHLVGGKRGVAHQLLGARRLTERRKELAFTHRERGAGHGGFVVCERRGAPS